MRRFILDNENTLPVQAGDEAVVLKSIIGDSKLKNGTKGGLIIVLLFTFLNL